MHQTENQLITIESKDAYAVFTTAGALDPIIARVKREIDKFEADATTERGRKEIKSMAYKVARSKTYVDDVGKQVAARVKEIPKIVDANRRHARETLERWQEEVRRPLTEWEEAEKKRVDAHVAAIDALRALAATIDDAGEQKDAATLRSSLQAAEAVTVDSSCEEFEEEYALAKKSTVETLTKAIAERERYEADQAELARLRKEQEEREARERQEAEEKAAREREEAAAERARQEAEEKARREAEQREAAARAEREAAEARERELERQKEEAEKRAAEAEERARREAEEERRREAEEAARRKANEEHRTKLFNEAVAALTAHGIKHQEAEGVISLIHDGAVPHVSITY